MVTTPTLQPDEFRHHQNVGLFNCVAMSAVGTIVGSTVVLFALWGKFPPATGLIWFSVINLIYFARCLDAVRFKNSRDAESNAGYWKTRFQVGLVFGSLAWGALTWFLYPVGDPASKALLILCVCAIAGGAMASLVTDRRALQIFYVCLFAGSFTRLLADGSAYAMLLAFFCSVIFILMMGAAMKLSNSFLGSMRLQLETQKSNLTLMQMSEQMAGIGYWSWVSGTNYIELSKSLSRLLNLDRSELSPAEFFSLIGSGDRLRVESIVRQQLDGGADEANDEVRLEFMLSSKNAEDPRYLKQITRRLIANEVECLFGSVQETTDIRLAQDKIYRMAYKDALTGLTNRTGFYEELDQALWTAEITNSELALLYIDLDDFKGVNDYYGHAHGDEYLVKLAEHLTQAIGSSHLVARLGGDEFCAVLAGPAATEVESVTEKIFEICKERIQILGQLIQPKLSIGVAMFPQHGTTGEELVSNADLAMYEAKRSNAGQVVFETSIAEYRNSQLEIENGLREAIDMKAFELWYQPKVNVKDGSISGVEALLRWRDKSGVLVSPSKFIPVAEHAGLIKDIGVWVLNAACEQLEVWNAAGYDLQMAINISGDHFSNDDFVADVSKATKDFQIQAEDLEIEITESLSRDPDVHLRICRALRDLGVKIAIDDFGTGYSSLSVLGQLEVDTLKIDQSFIMRLPQDEMSSLMVKKITELALGLGYGIVAEGVETKEQFEFLRSVGCPYIQGFYFSEALTAPHMTKMLQAEFLKPLQTVAGYPSTRGSNPIAGPGVEVEINSSASPTHEGQ